MDKSLVNKGFSLIEVLVALFVLAISMAAFMKSSISQIETISHLRNRSIAQWVASNQLAQVHLNPWPETGKANGREEMAGQFWMWTRIVQSTDQQDIRRVDVEIRFDTNDETPMVTLTGFVGRNE